MIDNRFICRHMESTSIDQLRKQVKDALNDLKRHLDDRKVALADALLNARFVSDVAEVSKFFY